MSQREYIMGEGPMVAVSCMGGRLAYVVNYIYVNFRICYNLELYICYI